ncbi:MAG: hypothetical protein LBL78_01115 [Prevotellaceae bacterium]|jgi:hypothetical protein|nr:hypothetical protein [Prevotellaceae bacterium]
MKEEDRIATKVGKEDGFRVPDGYFDSLASQVMSRLPEKEKSAFIPKKEPTKWERIRPLLYMAAMFVGAALIIRVATTHTTTAVSNPQMAIDDTEAVSDEYINSVLESSMLDDYSLYIYLSDVTAE